MGRTNNPDALQLSRRDLFHTFIAGSAAGAAAQPVAVQTPEPHDGLARCTVPEIRTKFGSFVADSLALNLQDFTLIGGVTNHTDRPWRWATFTLTMRDPSAQVIRHDDQFDATFYVKELRKGKTQPVISADGKPCQLLLHPARRPASIAVAFVPERSYSDSRCLFSLVHPAVSSDLHF